MMNLMFNPRGRKLTLDGAEVVWDAYFFVRSETSRGFWLFGFANSKKVWLAKAAWNELTRTKKRKPFPVGSNLLAAEVPPRHELMCAGGSTHGNLSAEQTRDMCTERGFDMVGRPVGPYGD
jgi:hypothetical protein